MNIDYFHIYHDSLHFPYQVDITRDDELTGQKGQRYTLCLWESNAKPHLYWFTAKFMRKKGDSQPVYHRESPCSGRFQDEMGRFEKFFKQKTNIAWDDRVAMQKTTSVDKFQYTPPGGGKPVGCLPHSFDYCLEINAKIRNLPWPPVEEAQADKRTEAVEGLPTPGNSDAGYTNVMNDVSTTANESSVLNIRSGYPDVCKSLKSEKEQEQEQTNLQASASSQENIGERTGQSECHQRLSSSPQRQRYGQDPVSRPNRPDSCRPDSFPNLGSMELPLSSPRCEESLDSQNLPIDYKGLGYAINRALRIPAISTMEGDEEIETPARSY